ncbi:MAG: thermopsin family protease, partial [Thermoplasmata archaeon]
MVSRTWLFGFVVFVAFVMVVSTFGIVATGSGTLATRAPPALGSAPTPATPSTTLASATESYAAPSPTAPATDATPTATLPANGPGGCSVGSQPSSPSPIFAANGDQLVNGLLEPGGQTAGRACVGNNTDPAPAPSGINYIGENNTNGIVGHNTIDSNSIAAIQTVYSTTSLFPDSLTPNRWGDQLNVILANVTVLGHRGYFYWVQSLAEYDTSNDTLSFYDATWNFTSGTSGKMFQSTLASWSP